MHVVRYGRHSKPSPGRVFSTNEKPKTESADRQRRHPCGNRVAAQATEEPGGDRRYNLGFLARRGVQMGLEQWTVAGRSLSASLSLNLMAGNAARRSRSVIDARDTHRPSKIACREALAKRRAQPVTCIGQHTTEAHASRGHAIDLSERDLRLGTCRSIFDRNTCTLQPR